MRSIIFALFAILPVFANDCLTFGGDVSIGEERYVLIVEKETVQEDDEEDIELTEAESQKVSESIKQLQAKMVAVESQDTPSAQVVGVSSSNTSVQNTQPVVEILGVPLSAVVTPETNKSVMVESGGTNDMKQVYSAVSLTEEELLGVGVSVMSYVGTEQTNESFGITSSSTSNDGGTDDPRANGSNFGGGASGGGGTGVSGLNGKNQYQTLVLDGSKTLNINKKYLKILYGNDTQYWDEDYSIPLVSFDIGTLIYNGITLDDTYELEHGLDYSEFINNVYFPSLDPEYVYRLELNNGAVMLWAKLPDVVPEPNVCFLMLVASICALNRKRT